MKELNLNSLVQIPATKDVLDFLRDEHINYWRSYGEQYCEGETGCAFVQRRIAEYCDPTVIDGLISMPLWSLMNKFGDSMGCGLEPYFVTILIDHKDLK